MESDDSKGTRRVRKTNFKTLRKHGNYITGINIIDDQLFWTDSYSEPKKISISIFKSGCSNNFTTHTKYTGKKIAVGDLSAASSFIEANICVAKKAPMSFFLFRLIYHDL